jgi:sugar lactone lactonase YvrE
MTQPKSFARLLIACALPLALMSASTGAAAAATRHAQVLPLPADWYPESVATGSDGSFYVGSWRQGAVLRLRPGAQEAEVLVTPGSNGLANAQGLLVDAKRNALWVCSGNSGFTTVAQTPSALKRYELSSGKPQASYAMPDAGYCNDLVQDGQGNLFVTDSLHPRILRLAAGTAALEVWKDDPLLGGAGPYTGLNGIAFDGEHQLIVSLVAAVPYVLSVSVDTDGAAGSVARIHAERVLNNVDAIRAIKPGQLMLFESNAFGSRPFGGQISSARIDGEQIKLRAIVTGLNEPSSGAVLGGRVYFIESKYPLLTQSPNGEAGIPRGVPFDLQSRELGID